MSSAANDNIKPPVRILVVDDEPALAELLGESLSVIGLMPTVCNDAEQALMLLKQHEFDAICSDMHMPGINGIEFYHMAVALRPFLKDRFIFLTGDLSNKETSDFLRDTNSLHIIKPFRLGQIQEAITKVLQANPPAPTTSADTT